MRGRYAYVSDSYAAASARASTGWPWCSPPRGSPVPRVLALPDRWSRIVGAAAARAPRRAARADFPEGGDEGPGLVVAYDLDRVGRGTRSSSSASTALGQVLFAHASCWTDPFPYAPDVTTYLYQTQRRALGRRAD